MPDLARFEALSTEQLQRRHDVVRSELEDARREFFGFDYWSDEEYDMRQNDIKELQGLLDQIEGELDARGEF